MKQQRLRSSSEATLRRTRHAPERKKFGATPVTRTESLCPARIFGYPAAGVLSRRIMPGQLKDGTMDSTPMELLTRAQRGDEHALIELLEANAPIVRERLARDIPQRWRSVFTVDDVMQQAYLDAFLSIRTFRFRGPGSFAAWLGTLARHNLLDTIKGLDAQKRGGARKKIDAVRHEESMVDLFAWLGGHSATPSRAAAQDEAVASLSTALAQLPDLYRTVVHACDIEGRSVHEVAEELQRSPGATYMLRARAHRMLADMLGTASQYLSRKA